MNARPAFAVLFALVTVTSVVAVPVAAASTDGARERIDGTAGVLPAAPPSSQVLDATDEVKIWERSVFPLRADPGDAAFTVDNAAWDAELEGAGRKSLNKDELAVYEMGDPVTLTFDDGRADAERELAGESVQLVAARLEADTSTTLDGFSTLQDLQSLLTQQNANDNASFEVVRNTSLDPDGDETFTYTPSQPGQYILFVATAGNGNLSAPGGDIQISGDNVTVVGVEALAVRRGRPIVAAGKQVYSTGEDVTFTVDTTPPSGTTVDTSGNVSHAILLYDEETYTDGVFNLVADDHLTTDFNVSENVTLEHSIDSVNGVQRSVDHVSAFGFTAGPGVHNGSNSLDAVLNFLVRNSNLSSSLKPKTTSTGQTELDASITAVNGTDEETIVVETRPDWREACYRWIHVATDDNGTELASRTGTVGVGTACTPPSPPARGGGGRSSGGGPPGSPGATASATGSAQVSVNTVGRQLTVNVEDAGEGDTVTVRRDEGTVADEVSRHGSALESVETTFSGPTDFDMRITQSNGKPDPSVPDPPSDRGTVGYINVQHSASDEAVGEVRFNFRVSQDRLDERGVDRDEVVLYRYSDGEWSALETSYVGDAPDGTPRFQAVSPDGLSVFAIGGEEAAPQQTTEEPPETTTEPPATTEAPPETTTEAPPGDGGDVTFVVLGLVIVAIVVVAGLWYYREQF